MRRVSPRSKRRCVHVHHSVVLFCSPLSCCCVCCSLFSLLISSYISSPLAKGATYHGEWFNAARALKDAEAELEKARAHAGVVDAKYACLEQEKTMLAKSAARLEERNKKVEEERGRHVSIIATMRDEDKNQQLSAAREKAQLNARIETLNEHIKQLDSSRARREVAAEEEAKEKVRPDFCCCCCCCKNLVCSMSIVSPDFFVALCSLFFCLHTFCLLSPLPLLRRVDRPLRYASVSPRRRAPRRRRRRRRSSPRSCKRRRMLTSRRRREAAT